jgi:hypothetical protein
VKIYVTVVCVQMRDLLFGLPRVVLVGITHPADVEEAIVDAIRSPVLDDFLHLVLGVGVW